MAVIGATCRRELGLKEKTFEERTHAPISTNSAVYRAPEWSARECRPLGLDPISKCATKL
jgi:hypothetical protein